VEKNSEITSAIQRYFSESQNDGSIVAIYLFGSFLRGETEKSSDVDLAFLLDEKVYRSDPIMTMSPAHLIAAEMGMEFNKETDVTILNSASLEIAYEVITSGKCVYESELDLRLEYEIKIKGMYFDFRPFLDDLRAKRLAQI
jgi:predicted nucleotidyltransferase